MYCAPGILNAMRKISPLGPPRETKVPIAFRLSPELLTRLRAVAKKHRHPLVTTLEWCLEKALPELER